MGGKVIRKTLKAVVAIVLFCIIPLSAQTAIVNALPHTIDAEEGSTDYTGDVDSGIMECLFDRGFIIFSQSTDDSDEVLLAMGRKTGADIVLSWSMTDTGLSASLLNCRSGEVTSSLSVSLKEFDYKYSDKHEMYLEMGVTLCEQLIPDDWN